MVAKIRNGFIEALDPDEVFVFGSNLAGRHGKGAALTARQRFGAIYGQGEGLQGNAYALPTKDERLRGRSLDEIGASLRQLATDAAQHSDRTFYLTRVGQGLAAMPEAAIRERVVAAGMPPNVKPWWDWEDGGSAPAAGRGAGLAARAFDIVSSRGKFDVLGMRQKGQTMATVKAPGEPGWLGNPYVADDAGGSYSRQEATELFGELIRQKAQDPQWREALLALEGKRIGYYKPEEEFIHLNALSDWIQEQKAPSAAPPVSPSLPPAEAAKQLSLLDEAGRFAGEAWPLIAALGGGSALVAAAMQMQPAPPEQLPYPPGSIV